MMARIGPFSATWLALMILALAIDLDTINYTSALWNMCTTCAR